MFKFVIFGQLLNLKDGPPPLKCGSQKKVIQFFFPIKNDFGSSYLKSFLSNLKKNI